MFEVILFWRVFVASGLVLVTSHCVGQESAIRSKELSSGDSLLIKDLFFKAIQQKSSGQLAVAEKTFDRVVLLQPDNDAAFFELARIHLEKGDQPAAEQALIRATEINRDNESYWSMLLDVYRQKGDLAALSNVYGELIRLQPDKKSNYFDKAYVLFLRKEYEPSLDVHDEITAKFGASEDPYLIKYQIYLAKGNKDEAINELESLLAKQTQEPRIYILLAELYRDVGKMKKAVAVLDQATSTFPNEPEVLLGKSDLYLAMGKEDEASGFLREAFLSDRLDFDAKAGVIYAIVSRDKTSFSTKSAPALAELLCEIYPKEPKAYAVLGDVFMQQQQLEQAQHAYLKALDINQYIEGVWQQLLQVEVQMGKYNEVEKHGKEALGLFPNHPLFLFFTGHGFLGNRKHQEAREYFEASLNSAGEEHIALLTQLYSNLGDVYNTLSMYAESDVAYEEAIALDSTNAYALNNYAYYLALRKQRLSEAAAMSKRSNEILKDYASYQDTYSWVFFQQGNFKEALVWIEKAIANSKESSETLLEHYGDILAKLGDTSKAVSQWKKARAISQSVGKDIDKLTRKINAKQYID